ncbi:MAG: hypothetical protein DDT35_01465 [Firmicutes bacterium]|nr:hypothetical protein [Bacillota bacterium]
MQGHSLVFIWYPGKILGLVDYRLAGPVAEGRLLHHQTPALFTIYLPQKQSAGMSHFGRRQTTSLPLRTAVPENDVHVRVPSLLVKRRKPSEVFGRDAHFVPQIGERRPQGLFPFAAVCVPVFDGIVFSQRQDAPPHNAVVLFKLLCDRGNVGDSLVLSEKPMAPWAFV